MLNQLGELLHYLINRPFIWFEIKVIMENGKIS